MVVKIDGLSLLNLLISNINHIENFLITVTQVEGAIIAIFISLLLVAIQLTIREYSDIVLEVYSHYWPFWLMFLSYILSIIYNVSLLYIKNLEWWLFTIGYCWSILNLTIFPVVLLRIFQLFKTEQFIERFIKVVKLFYKNRDSFRKLFNICFRCIQTRNIDALLIILEKIYKFYMNDPDYRNVIDRLKKLSNNENQEKNDKGLENDLEDVLMFIEFLALYLRGLGLKTIGQYDIGLITKHDMFSVIDWIGRSFQKIFSDLDQLQSTALSIDEENKIHRSLNNCLSEFRDIIMKMKEFDDFEINEKFRQFKRMYDSYVSEKDPKIM